jgi:ABC-type transporter Mla MlaB component
LLFQFLERVIAVLRTMITEAPFEQRWVLQGRLCNQWAADLKERWESTRSAREGRKCTIDLENVTMVDAPGEEVLLEMVREGALLLATRAYMKEILQSLNVVPRSARPGQ